MYRSPRYCFDDSTVFEVSEETVKKQEAYVLFYQRRPDFRKRKKAMELISRCIKDGQEYVQRSLQSTKQQVSSGRAETKDAWQHSLRCVCLNHVGQSGCVIAHVLPQICIACMDHKNGLLFSSQPTRQQKFGMPAWIRIVPHTSSGR